MQYITIASTVDAVDFRAENIVNFDSLEKNSIDLYSSMKSVYLQSRERKIKNSTVAFFVNPPEGADHSLKCIE